MGDAALLCDVAGPNDAAALYRALRERAVEGVEDLVPAAATLLVRFDPRVLRYGDVAALVAAAGTGAAAGAEPPGATVEIPVRYDGADLDEVARTSGMSVDRVVAAHTGSEFTVAFFGFAPGFAYLSGLDPLLRLPRRDTPRTRVPAGSVAVAGEWAAVYPRATPGGWRLLGHTDVPMWDLAATPPSPLVPGARVRFVAVG